MTTLKEKLIKIGAKVVNHGRYVVFQMAEVAIPRQMFQQILRLIAELGRSHHQRRCKAVDRNLLESKRQEECVQMPAKVTRSTPQPSFVLPKVTVAVQTSLCLAGRREKRQYSRRFGSHLGNIG